MKDNYDPEAWKHWPHHEEPVAIGVDQGAPNGDATVVANWRRVDGAVFICEVPKDLGHVTRLRVQGGKVYADTESGIPMIIPVL